MMKLGIGSYALAWSIGVPGYAAPSRPLAAEELLKLAAEAGVRLVQIADNMSLERMSDDELARIKNTSDALGIELETGMRGTEPDRLLRHLDIANALGAKMLRTLVETPDVGAAERQLREALPAFERAGVTIGVENHGLHTTRQLTELFDRIGSPYVGSCLDTVNSFGAVEDPERVVDALVPYIVNLHIKDFEIRRIDHQMGFVVIGAPSGRGRLNIPELLEKIVRAGKSPTAIVELWTPYDGGVDRTARTEREWLAESLAYLKGLSAFAD